MSDESILLSATAAAAALSISRRQLDRLWTAGELRTLTIGRRRLFPRAEIEEWANRRLLAENTTRPRTLTIARRG